MWPASYHGNNVSLPMSVASYHNNGVFPPITLNVTNIVAKTTELSHQSESVSWSDCGLLHLWHNRLARNEVFLCGLEGDKYGFLVHGCEVIQGARERVDVQGLHGQVDAGSESRQLTWQGLVTACGRRWLAVVWNIWEWELFLVV